MNYAEMDKEHQRLLSQIMAHETEVKTEPVEKMNISCQLFPVEECDEYVEDPKNLYAKTDNN